MGIKEIKKEMLAYRDFYGGDLLDSADIKNAKTKKELAGIIENHRNHLEMQACDATSNLDRFRQKLGLHLLD